MSYVWVALGGAVGSVARFWMSSLITSVLGDTFPWNTLVVNVTGSFAIGILAALLAPGATGSTSAPALRDLLMVGICGGYTTFSSFSLQTLNLLRGKAWLYASGNIVLSVVLCLAAVWLGYLAASLLRGTPNPG